MENFEEDPDVLIMSETFVLTIDDDGELSFIRDPTRSIDRTNDPEPEYYYCPDDDDDTEPGPIVKPIDGEKCIICLEGFRSVEEKQFLPCAHSFHDYCLDRWLRAHNTCPVCRTVPADETAETAYQ